MTHTLTPRSSARRVLLFGEFGPILLAFARSCTGRGIECCLLETSQKSDGWRSQSSAVARGKFFAPELLGTDAGIDVIADYAEPLPVLVEAERQFGHEHHGQEGRGPGPDIGGGPVALDEVGQALTDEPPLGPPAQGRPLEVIHLSESGP